jgi:hypothetical protein
MVNTCLYHDVNDELLVVPHGQGNGVDRRRGVANLNLTKYCENCIRIFYDNRLLDHERMRNCIMIIV